MVFLPSLSPEELRRYHCVIAHAEQVHSHFDVLVWLQGDMQRYLRHDILLAAWGNFQSGAIHHDLISTLAGVRSQDSDPGIVTPLLLDLFAHWTECGHRPFATNSGTDGFLQKNPESECVFSSTFQTMRFAMAHGICDKRASHDCFYVTFRAQQNYNETELSALSALTPCIDAVLRQVELLPHQASTPIDLSDLPNPVHEWHLSDRELEVLQWVGQGKTNPEIGNILKLSEFTVKNHLQRIFKKLDVSNRAQAVGKIRTQVNNV